MGSDARASGDFGDADGECGDGAGADSPATAPPWPGTVRDGGSAAALDPLAPSAVQRPGARWPPTARAGPGRSRPRRSSKCRRRCGGRGAAPSCSAYIKAVGKDGLDPRDYNPAWLESALKSGDPPRVSAAANTVWPLVVRDLALGHVRGAARVQWFVKDPDLPEGRTRELLDAALAGPGVGAMLDKLLPTHPQYGALQALR